MLKNCCGKHRRNMMRGLTVFCIVAVPMLFACATGGHVGVEGNFTTSDGFIYGINNDLGITITGYNGVATDIIIPAMIDGRQVTVIGPGAFKGINKWGKWGEEYIKVTSLVLPEGLVAIDDGAFCFNRIEELVIPESVRYIGKNAFAINDIELLVISNTLQHIGRNAFRADSRRIIINGDGLILETRHGFKKRFVECYNEHGRSSGEYMSARGSTRWEKV
ncbi:MAG: leucine-rich repeat domain-containing protein [Treponema sp.]|jgi:hypothetical protein|nr:leucine-rich repeat domain-containing protein [Treponema sp.]